MTKLALSRDAKLVEFTQIDKCNKSYKWTSKIEIT